MAATCSDEANDNLIRVHGDITQEVDALQHDRTEHDNNTASPHDSGDRLIGDNDPPLNDSNSGVPLKIDISGGVQTGGVLHKPAAVLIERESQSRLALVVMSSAAVLVDLLRQMCTYAVKYENLDNYPVPPTLLVFLAELIKLVTFCTRLIAAGKLRDVKISYAYIVPSLLYAVNNNIYFVALTFTTPPVWNILMQARVICTAVVYRFYFKKPITGIQWVALAMLTMAICVLQFSGHSPNTSGSTSSSHLIIILLLALVASICATIGPVYAEYLLKNDTRTFDDKQFQMYLFGAGITFVVFTIHIRLTSDDLSSLVNVRGNELLVWTLLIACVILAASCGIIVAIIMKKLDNIVKLYTQAVSSGLTCLACIVLFPRMFTFDILFIVSLLMTCVAIYLYEVKTIQCKRKDEAAQ